MAVWMSGHLDRRNATFMGNRSQGNVTLYCPVRKLAQQHSNEKGLNMANYGQLFLSATFRTSTFNQFCTVNSFKQTPLQHGQQLSSQPNLFFDPFSPVSELSQVDCSLQLWLWQYIPNINLGQHLFLYSLVGHLCHTCWLSWILCEYSHRKWWWLVEWRACQMCLSWWAETPQNMVVMQWRWVTCLST